MVENNSVIGAGHSRAKLLYLHSVSDCPLTRYLFQKDYVYDEQKGFFSNK